MISGKVIIFSITMYSLLIIEAAALDSENIIGNLLAEPNQFKYVVSIRSDGYHICGGSLIADDVVLTAAHCFLDLTSYEFVYKNYEIFAGTTNSNETRSDRKSQVSKIYVLKGFKKKDGGSMIDDLAVLRLKTSFDIANSSDLAALKLPTKNDSIEGKVGVVTGFGYNEIDFAQQIAKGIIKGSTDARLRYGYFKLSRHYYAFKEDERFITGTVNKTTKRYFGGTCNGDSGSSVVRDNKVVGVLNTAAHCYQDVSAAIFTDIVPYLGFIEGAINDKPTAATNAIDPNPPDVLSEIWKAIKKPFS